MKVINAGTQTITDYYKWGEINATVVGSPTNNNGVFSDFSSSNYLAIPQFTQNGSPWEMVLKLEDTGNSDCWLMGNGYFGQSTYTTGVNIRFPSAGTIYVHLGFGYPNNYATLSATVATSGIQYIKVTWDCAKYCLYVSNTSTFSDEPDYSWSCSTNVSQSYLYINTYLGYNAGQGGISFLGKIHLKECYIKINGEYWWRGYSVVSGTANDYNWLTTRTETITKVFSYNEQETETYWSSWKSPTLTSNTSYGTISGSMGYTWFNGSSGSAVAHANGATYASIWELPEPIKFSKVYWYYKANPDRWGITGTMRFYSVAQDDTETLIGTASYTGSGGSANLDDSVEVTKLKVTVVGTWSGANGVWHLPISFDGYIQRTKVVTPVYTTRV